MTTQCKTCTNRNDCWVKATIELKKGFRMTDLNPNEQQIVINASNGSCDCYTSSEASE